jgi:hypothetical protein
MKCCLLLLLLCGCSTIEKPYIKETVNKPDGTWTVREMSADRITGGKASGITVLEK